ncbi:MAG: hypothetical protein KDE27_20225 [Planctomycetes bacterium]|nr:hypothetical protein [Planctomycetota bacterium]
MAAPGKGLSYDGGEAFGFSMDNQLQTRFGYLGGDVARDVTSFDVPRARTLLRGHAFKKSIQYYLQLDAVDDGLGTLTVNGPIKDAHITWNFIDDDSGTIGLRMGQGKTQFGLSGTGEARGLFFLERSAAANGFSRARSTGAWVMGSHMENKLRWSAGLMNGATAAGLGAGYVDVGEEAANSDNEVNAVFTAEFDPMGDTTGGKGREYWYEGDFRTEDRGLQGSVRASLAIENGKDTSAAANDIEGIAFTIGTVWSIEGFQFLGEWFTRTDEAQSTPADEEQPMGWSVQGVWVMPKSADAAIQWGFGARVCMVETDNGLTGSGVNFVTGLSGLGAVNGDSTEVTLAANAFYHEHACKTTFEYTFQQVSPTGGTDLDNHIVGIGFQLLF